MSTLPHNHILQGLSGKLGRIVVRQLHGKTIVQAAPVRKALATPGELTNREAFKAAVVYAKQAKLNPELWEMYRAEAKRRGGTSNAYAVAISDYRKGLLLAGNLQNKSPKKILKRPAAPRPLSGNMSSISDRKLSATVNFDTLFSRFNKLERYQLQHAENPADLLIRLIIPS